MENNATQSIQLRHSVRTYEHKPLSTKDRQLLNDYIQVINQTKGPFGSHIRIQLVEKRRSKSISKTRYLWCHQRRSDIFSSGLR